LMDADGKNQTRLTNTKGNSQNPAWSPDGSKILFSSNRTGATELFTIKVDGTSTVQLTTTGARNDYPAWSPDGEKIVLISNRIDPASDIFLMDADGSRQTRLTPTRDWDLDPSFSRDGKKIVFNSRRDGRRGIYVMNVDGSDQIKLTNLAVNPFVSFIRTKGVDAGLKFYRDLRKRNPQPTLFTESEIRNLAFELLDKTETTDAIKLFTLVTEAYPTSSLAFSTLSEALTRAGKKAPPTEAQFITIIKNHGPVEAARIFAEVKKKYPRWILISEAQVNRLARASLQSGQAEVAIKTFDLGLKTYPKSANLHEGLADAYNQAGNQIEAIKHYRLALEINANNPRVKQILERLEKGGTTYRQIDNSH